MLLHALLLLALGGGLAHAQSVPLIMNCGADQACCDGILALKASGSFTCMNDGRKGTAIGTKGYEKCYKCIQNAIPSLRPLAYSGTCAAGSLEAYCQVVPYPPGQGPPVPAPTYPPHVKPPTPSPTQTPAPVPGFSPGPPGTGATLECGQHLVDTCCQWGTEDLANYPQGVAQSCTRCLVSQIGSLRPYIGAQGQARCSQMDLTFYCTNWDWKEQMEAFAGRPTFTSPSAKTCKNRRDANGNPLTVPKSLVDPCDGIKGKSACKATIQPNGNACVYASKKCSMTLPCSGYKGKKACKAAAACEYVNKQCQDKPPAPTTCSAAKSKTQCKAVASGTCAYKSKICYDKAGTCADFNNAGFKKAKTAEKLCKGLKAGCTWNSALTRCLAQATTPKPSPAPASGCKQQTKKSKCSQTLGCKWSNNKGTCS